MSGRVLLLATARATDVVRVLWTAVFAFAVLGYPAGMLVAMFSGPAPTRRHYAQPRAAPSPPERIEPIGPR